MNNKIIIGFVSVLAVAVALVSFVTGFSEGKKNVNTGLALYNTTPSFPLATSTWYTIGATSVRILASSTNNKRQSVTIQPVNCSSGSAIFLSTNDAAALAGQGLAVYASTTLQMTDYPELPVVQGSMRAIAGAGTCTVLVNEWKAPQ